MKLDQFKSLKSISGNSLMEFAVTIGLMAILAATAAPKLSQMGENTKISILIKIDRNKSNHLRPNLFFKPANSSACFLDNLLIFYNGASQNFLN